MDARSHDPRRGDPRVHKLAGTRLRFDWGIVRYRLDVVATSVADAVEHAGGWLFDRAAAGWEVSVLVPEPDDDRPLRILGAEVLDLRAVLDTGGVDRRPHAIAVAAELIDWDARMADGLRRALDDGGIQVVGWGANWPAVPEYRVDPVLHHLSAAAQVFKAQALAAAGVRAAATGPTETLCSGMAWWPPVVADLSPVGG
ncbi:hypothetical protein ACFYTQ_13735 [Nocardia sp. NPDC004068]|uniref:hypothetical protein n=1 Tax=Nocardia sp. NPDC004068 TaxID=3364303 RepID=UPI0036782C9E